MSLQQLLRRNDIPPDVHEIIARALSEQRNAHKQVAVQRDLAIGLLEAGSLDEALSLGIETTLNLPDIDAGVVYVPDEAGEYMTVASARGVSTTFLRQASRLKLTAERTQLIASGRPLYIARHDMARRLGGSPQREGLTAVAVIPLLHRGRASGTLCVASRSQDEIPVAARQPLDTIAAMVGNAVARFEAEQALGESEERFRTAVESSPDPVFIVDADGVLVSANPPMGEHFQRPTEELVGLTAHDLFPHDLAEERVARLRKVLETGEAIAVEDRGAAPGAAGKWYHVTYTPLRRPDGRIQSVLGRTRDITHLKRAEQALRESEELHRALVESSPDLIFSLDRDGTLLSVNRATAERVQRPAEELVGLTMHDIIPEEIADRRLATVREVIDTGESRVTQELGATVPEAWFRLMYAPVRGADGRIRMVVGVGYDITKRKRAEEALRESERRYAMATSAGKVGVWEWDTETGKLTGDHVLRDMLGYKDDEVPDHVDSLRRLIHPGDVTMAMEAIEAHGKGRTPSYEATYRGVHKDGGIRWFFARGTPMPDQAGKPRRIVGTTVDVTELKEAEEERRRLEERVRRSEQLERLGVFVGGLAHDFRNIISGIVNNASHALDALPQDGEARTAVEHIEAAAERAAELSGEMLSYAGRGKSDTQPLDLSTLVDQAIDLVQSSIPNNVTVCRALAADLPAVEGDATQLRHVAMNLVTNAAEAIVHNPEGTVTVATGVREVDEAYLSHTYVDDSLAGGHYVYLEVADTGCGMDEAAQARAFDPFFSTKPEGRGLGLAAVLGIVRGHRGAIDVASEPEHGTTITVLLPASRAAPLPAEPLTAGKTSAADGWQGSGTVLFAEDEAMSRWAGKLSLEKAGFTVLLARDGREAVDLFREHADSIVAVLLDVRMPDLNGREAFEELRRTHPGTRVIVVSGTEEEEDVRQSFGDGLAGFVPKPHSPEELISAVRKSLEQ